MTAAAITTERLLLRRWREADTSPFYTMGQDEAVMRYLGPPVTLADARAAGLRQNDVAEAYGRCFWALERRSDGVFLGFCGVKPGPPATPVADLPEIGWRLRRDAWGQGYAVEAARACLDAEWHRGTAEVFAITVPANTRSRRVMDRLDMAHRPALDFAHPALAHDDPLRAHVVYSIRHPG